MHVDVAVIGAGIAGLTCAQRLQQFGYRVAVLEKSRGVGGRMATRRLHGTCADHGVCYVVPQEKPFTQLIEHLHRLDMVQVWTQQMYQWNAGSVVPQDPEEYPRYVASTGMTAIAKFLATGLDIRLSQRVTALSLTATPTHRTPNWQLSMEPSQHSSASETPELTANAIVIAIPAPQALALLQPLAPQPISASLVQQLEAVTFSPCISVMAGYSAEHQQDWQARYGEAKAITNHATASDWFWVGLDSSKRRPPGQPVFVVQSTSHFAERYLEVADLAPVGEQLLQQAATHLAPWLAHPDWMQVHRWRYAFAAAPLEAHYLPHPGAVPLVCCGDWCGGRRVERAFDSGLATATWLNGQLQQRPAPSELDWAAIAP